MKLKLLPVFLVAVFIYSCNKNEEEIVPDVNKTYEESVISYFKDIALGFESGNASSVTRKWKQDMKIFVGGSKDSALLVELAKIISEINLLTLDGFTIYLTEDSLNANFYLFLGSGTEYATIFPSQSDFITTSWGLFHVYFTPDDVIYRGHMYVDIVRANQVEQKHLLREELTQSLGLANDSNQYPDSIFQQDWTTTTSYSQLDPDLIKLLYHPQMTTGLDANRVEPVLKSILPQIL